jgi:hypothetical protein
VERIPRDVILSRATIETGYHIYFTTNISDFSFKKKNVNLLQFIHALLENYNFLAFVMLTAQRTYSSQIFIFVLGPHVKYKIAKIWQIYLF